MALLKQQQATPVGGCRWPRFFDQVQETWQVLRYYAEPQHITVYYHRDQIKLIWIYPSRDQRSLRKRRIWHRLALGNLYFFCFTLLLALLEASENIVQLGQDLLWTLGSTLLLFFTTYFHLHTDDIDEVLDELDAIHRSYAKAPGAAAIRAEQRRFFLMESFLGAIWYTGILMFCCLVATQPLWSNQLLPFNAVFPFDLQDPLKHPVGHKFCYLYQVFCVFYFIITILNLEMVVVHGFPQIALNMKIIGIQLRQFGRLSCDDEQQFRSEFYRIIRSHQRVVRVSERFNAVFYGPLLFQMVNSFLMISLSTFEALASRRDPAVASRFVVFMILSFCHLSYWSVFGDLVTYESQQVALAAYDIYEWHCKSTHLQRDIMFLIQRAQKPLKIEASPMPSFCLSSYMAVLNLCYRILTLLLESLD